jgi:hypothetical protein
MIIYFTKFCWRTSSTTERIVLDSF